MQAQQSGIMAVAPSLQPNVTVPRLLPPGRKIAFAAIRLRTARLRAFGEPGA